MAQITRTYTFTDGTTAYGSQVESEVANIVNTWNNHDSGATAWTLIKIGDGLYTAPVIKSSIQTNTGIYFRGSNIVGLTSNGTRVAEFTVGETDFYVDCLPVLDNIYSCGKSGQKWTAVWATNGSIQTSVSSTKKNIVDLDVKSLPVVRGASFERLDSDDKHIGFIADNLPPEAFAINKDGTRSETDIYTGAVIGILAAQVSDLMDRLSKLEGNK